MMQTEYPDPDGSPITTAERQLDSRESDGIHIQLLWDPHGGHISVAATTSASGSSPHGV